jgi:hypothetical protein
MLLAMTGTSVTSTALFTPQLSFVSDTYFVASHQESGSATITVSSWATTGWAQADLLVGAVPFSTTNPEWATNTGGTTPGSLIAATTSTGQLEVIPVAGPASAAILVDVPGTTSFVMQKSGDGIVYGNSVTGSVSTSTLPTAAPLPIVATGFGGFYTEFGPLGTSPNEGEVLFYKTALAASAGGGVNLYVAPNVTASMATTLLGTTTGAVFGDIFTADSNYVLYVTQLEAASVPNAAVGNLNAWDIAGAKNVVVSGDDNMWDSDALTGSTIIYNDNFLAPMGATIGVADLKTVDVSATTLAPKLIQSEGDMNFFLTSDKLKVIFTITQAGNQTTDGIYYYPL